VHLAGQVDVGDVRARAGLDPVVDGAGPEDAREPPAQRVADRDELVAADLGRAPGAALRRAAQSRTAGGFARSNMWTVSTNRTWPVR
jgi:hypothetical protein